jgi:hypothetical protein
MGIAPSTDVPFPFHRNYRHSQIAQRVAVAGLEIVAEHYSHYFVRLPAGFPGSELLMRIDRRLAWRSRDAPALARQFAESAVLTLRARR